MFEYKTVSIFMACDPKINLLIRALVVIHSYVDDSSHKLTAFICKTFSFNCLNNRHGFVLRSCLMGYSVFRDVTGGTVVVL